MRVNVDHKTKIRREIPADLFPVVTPVVASHYVPMLLHEKHAGPRRMHRNVMNAMTNFGGRIWNVQRVQSLVNRLPRLAAIVGSKSACCRNSDIDSLWIARIENDRV